MAPKRQRDCSGVNERTTSRPTSTKRLNFSTSSRAIKVSVGTVADAKNFYIHEDVLKRHSDFFKAALSNKWREAGDGQVQLPEDYPQTFEAFANFVYSGHLSVPQDNSSSDHTKELMAMTSCWLLGDKLLSQAFKDASVDRLAELVLRARCYPTIELHRNLYRYSDLPSGLKRLLVDFAVFRWEVTDFQVTPRVSAEAAFFADTTIRALGVTPEDRSGREPWDRARCKYHDHGEKTPCYKTMF